MAKELSEATRQKYDLFVAAYIRCFNATKAAVEAGYKASNTKNQGSNMHTYPYIKEKINVELGRLRQRFADEGNRAFAILSDLDLKLRRHDEAELKINKYENELIKDNNAYSILNRQIEKLARKIKKGDGRKKDSKEKKKTLLIEIEELQDESFQMGLDLRIKKRLVEIENSNILKPAQ